MFIRNAYGISLSPMPAHAPEVLREGVDKLKMPYWLTTGTLLGLYRDKRLIPHDTDLDVAVMGYDHVWADLITQLLGFQVIRIVINHNKVQQIAFKRREVIFDVFVYWPRENALMWDNYGESGRLEIAHEELVDMQTLQTEYGTFKVPRNVNRYLTDLYGNWKVPSKDKPRYK